jgi:hypothetical protein
MSMGRKRVVAVVAACVAAGAGGIAYTLLHRHAAPSGPPPRSQERIVPPAIASTIAVPLSVDLGALQRLLDEEIPQDLWTIDQPGATCVKPQKVKLFGADIGVTPRLTCHIVGTARRGPIVLHGAGQDILADLPIIADVTAKGVGGIADAHATGRAMAHARIRLSITRDWHAHGTLRLTYDWSTPPGVDVLGQRITFADKADEKLGPVVARLEQKLPAQLERWNLRGQIEGLWRRGFAVINVNEDNPPVWMRVTPQGLDYGGYTIVGNRLALRLGLVALTQAVVGARPADPAPTPLPAMPQGQVALAPDGPRRDAPVRIFAPVIADYDQLVPVIGKALAKRAARPFDLPGLGAVTASFANIEVFAATQGRIAVGADISARGDSTALGPVHGRIWFAARPDNADGSQLVHFNGLTVSGDTDAAGGNLLLAVANSPGFSQAIAEALQQNFTHDFDKLQGKIRRAIDARQQGDFRIAARLDQMRNGRLQPYANGLYMPVWLTGQASIAYAPGR